MEKLGKEIDKISNQLTDLRWEIWTKHTLFTWQWWMLLGACFLMIILFFVLVKKEKLLPSIAFLGFIYILNKNLDDVATAMDWYDYRMQLEPIIPTMLPANLFIIPIGLSIIYHRFEEWKSFLIVSGFFSAFVSYLALPLMKIANIYLEKAWNAHWSFISLVVMSIISKLVVDRVKSLYRVQSEKAIN
ncbi:CBO0543 family protein [Halalkalibacter urbisdiaboli]|uniref:CBO0543 family protein n=1 Tax=Halalkalibacter urbisdiaboli TaxID=1960589 RepID=UPI000B438580|nr:CBO0543 family protein [Halalkalibacter urbisdiaboli]